MSYNFSPRVVYNGLVFYFDTANTRCFVPGNTYATDLTTSNVGLTFKRKVYNGGTGDIVTTIVPTFSTDNRGIILFNGVNVQTGDGLYLPDNETVTNLSTHVTLSTWFKKSAYKTYVECPAAKGFNSPGTQPFAIYLLNNTVNFRLTTNTTNGLTDISTTYNLNVWNNVSVTYDGANMKIYVNGVLKNSTAKTGPIMNAATSPFNIGCQYNGGYFPSYAVVKTNEYFDGYISNVSLYNRALLDAEVLQNYNALKSRFGIA